MTFNVVAAEVQINATTTGTASVAALNAELGGLQTSVANMTKQQQSFLGSLERLTQTFGKSRSEVLAMKAEMLGVGAAAAPMIGTLEKMGIDGKHSFAQMIASGGVFRELIVLIHESLIMGNYSRFGGSMMVLAEKTGMSAAIFTVLGAAVLGTVGALGALGAAFIEGELQSTRFARAMSLTGGIAGVTEGQFNAMAETIGSNIPGSVLTARNALQDLVSTGAFTGATLASVAQAAVMFSQYSGETAAQAVKDFAGMKDGVTKWAEKENEQYHFLTLAQYDYIQTLEQQGQTEAAEKAAADDFYTHMRQTGVQNLGYLEEAWNGVTGAMKGTWDAMESWGRQTTLEDQLATLQSQKLHPDRIVNRTSLDPQIAAIQAQIKANDAAAAAQAKADQTQQLGISARDNLKAFLPPEDQVKAKVAKLKQDIAQALAANPNDATALNLQAHLGDAIARIQKEYGHAAGAGALNKPDIHGFAISSDDTAKLQVQLSLMQEYARATHMSESAVLKLNIAAGKLSGFTAPQIKELQDRAARDDALAQQKAASGLQGKFQSVSDSLSGKNAGLQTQLQQLQQYGTITKATALDLVNLQIAQGDLKGISQSEIDSLRQMATANDKLTASISATKTSAQYGTQQAFSNYLAQAQDTGKQMQKVWGDVFSGMQNIMVTALEGGKEDWRGFALSVIDDMLKMEVESQIMAPIIKALGGVGGGTNGSGLGGVVSGIIGGIGSGFGSGGAMSTASLVAHQGGAGSMLGGVGSYLSSLFANGGIMTSGGPLPLNKYANGGVANSPQMAIFGEGRGPEAYVPLPDGRSIPVNMRGGGGGGGQVNHVTNHISIASDGSSQVTPQQANQMAQGLTYAIQQELIRQHRDGGIFSSTSGLR